VNQILDKSIKKFEQSENIKKIIIYILLGIILLGIRILLMFNVMYFGNPGRIIGIFLSLIAMFLGALIIILGIKLFANISISSIIISIVSFIFGIVFIFIAGFATFIAYAAIMINR